MPVRGQAKGLAPTASVGHSKGQSQDVKQQNKNCTENVLDQSTRNTLAAWRGGYLSNEGSGVKQEKASTASPSTPRSGRGPLLSLLRSLSPLSELLVPSVKVPATQASFGDERGHAISCSSVLPILGFATTRTMHHPDRIPTTTHTISQGTCLSCSWGRWRVS